MSVSCVVLDQSTLLLLAHVFTKEVSVRREVKLSFKHNLQEVPEDLDSFRNVYNSESRPS